MKCFRKKKISWLNINICCILSLVMSLLVFMFENNLKFGYFMLKL